MKVGIEKRDIGESILYNASLVRLTWGHFMYDIQQCFDQMVSSYGARLYYI